MNIQRFEDIIAWQKAKELTLYIYKAFRENKDYCFRDQIQRASVSIMNNIAEGFQLKGAKEYARFLYIAKGSAGEVRSMLHLAKELRFIDEDICELCNQLAEEIPKILAGLIKAVKR